MLHSKNTNTNNSNRNNISHCFSFRSMPVLPITTSGCDGCSAVDTGPNQWLGLHSLHCGDSILLFSVCVYVCVGNQGDVCNTFGQSLSGYWSTQKWLNSQEPKEAVRPRLALQAPSCNLLITSVRNSSTDYVTTNPPLPHQKDADGSGHTPTGCK